MFRRLPRLFLAGLLLCAVFLPNAAAQSAQARRDSIAEVKRVIEEFKTCIAVADSSHDAVEGARQRIMLAALSKKAQALKLYGEAALIADTAHLDGDEELRARQGAVEIYRADGKWRQAYEEQTKVAALELELQKEQTALSATEREERESAELAQRDSLIEGLHAVNDTLSERLLVEEARADQWRLITLVTGAVLLLAMVLVLVRMGRAQRRTQKELEALRTEVASLKVSAKNRFREPTPVPIVEPTPTPALVAPTITSSVDMDEALLGLFRKRAPERLATLRDARSRSDDEKVVRVVHTLKPQLIALDPEGLGALCARIAIIDAQQDRGGWNAALDQVEAGVERLMV